MTTNPMTLLDRFQERLDQSENREQRLLEMLAEKDKQLAEANSSSNDIRDRYILSLEAQNQKKDERYHEVTSSLLQILMKTAERQFTRSP